LYTQQGTCQMEKIQTDNQKESFEKNSYEYAAWQDRSVICGVDEVGRGCLAGPLVTGAAILPIGCNYPGLKDSKLMSEQEREKAYQWIVKNCLYSIGIISHQTIDQCNIWNATLIGMKKAVLNLLAVCSQRPSAILIDAMPLKLLDTDYKEIPIFHFTKGESKSTSIAAASIVAKVTRDRLMKKLDPIFPGYRLAQHKGYSTKQHKAAVLAEGRSIIHRVSFLGKTLNMEKNEKQQSLF